MSWGERFCHSFVPREKQNKRVNTHIKSIILPFTLITNAEVMENAGTQKTTGRLRISRIHNLYNVPSLSLPVTVAKLVFTKSEIQIHAKLCAKNNNVR